VPDTVSTEESDVNSRERVFRCLDFEEPDRVPVDFWMSEGFRLKLERTLDVTAEQFLDLHDVDLRYIRGPEYVGPLLGESDDGSEEDIWGVRRRLVEVPVNGGIEYYKELVESPLATCRTAGEIEAYRHWPSPEWFDYSGIEEQCEEVRRKGRVAVFVGDRLNRIAQLKPAMYLRGIEQILTDVLVSPEIARAVFMKIREFYLEYATRIFEAANGKLDIVLTGDDFGSQNGPLLSPGMWAEFLGDGFAAYVEIAKRFGLKAMHHTCGSVGQLIPLMMDRGLDILQSLQPETVGMGPWELKAAFGDRLSFHGGISIQKTLPFGSSGDVRKEVGRVVEALAPGGGYILCTSHNIQADVPVENVIALVDAYKEFGRRK
jgi:uroporphyrinogen decarboxylase